MNLLKPEFIHQDDRRKLIQIFTADIKQVNIYEAKKGSELGNHYHKETDEFFYIIKGIVLYNKTQMLSEGDIFVVYPEENHLLLCLTDVQFMTFLTKPFDKENPDLWTSSY